MRKYPAYASDDVKPPRGWRFKLGNYAQVLYRLPEDYQERWLDHTGYLVLSGNPMLSIDEGRRLILEPDTQPAEATSGDLYWAIRMLLKGRTIEGADKYKYRIRNDEPERWVPIQNDWRPGIILEKMPYTLAPDPPETFDVLEAARRAKVGRTVRRTNDEHANICCLSLNDIIATDWYEATP